MKTKKCRRNEREEGSVHRERTKKDGRKENVI
jgi:hypothetical protein